MAGDRSRVSSSCLELETGPFRNFEVGAGLQVATEDDGARATTGFDALEVEALYNFRNEG